MEPIDCKKKLGFEATEVKRHDLLALYTGNAFLCLASCSNGPHGHCISFVAASHGVQSRLRHYQFFVGIMFSGPLELVI